MPWAGIAPSVVTVELMRAQKGPDMPTTSILATRTLPNEGKTMINPSTAATSSACASIEIPAPSGSGALREQPHM